MTSEQFIENDIAAKNIIIPWVMIPVIFTEFISNLIHIQIIKLTAHRLYFV